MEISEMQQKTEKINLFLKCIWVSCGKFLVLRGEYLSLTVNVLTTSSNISDMPRRDIFQLNFLWIDEKYDKSAAVWISAVFGTL